MRQFLFILLFCGMITSCCIRRQTYAQSDRFDTHNPFLPIVECIPCGNLQNTSETSIWTEAYGAIGKWMIGVESGYNFNHFRLFGDAGVHWWPSGKMSWAYREQVGMALLNPNKIFRPEIGIGLQQRYFRGGNTITTPSGDIFQPYAPSMMHQAFMGIRVNIPASNMILSLRTYRIQEFRSSKVDWNIGIQLGFRF